MIRQEITKTLELVGHCVQLFGRSARYIPQLPQQGARVLDHAFNIGYRTFPIVAVMSFFIGSVLALQTGYSLGQIAGGQT
ncbi:MAG TPA: ABC transporter permease, partial [Opitutales bacterium]|nr:ABC transporter permease [Opitutales bacterium]